MINKSEQPSQHWNRTSISFLRRERLYRVWDQKKKTKTTHQGLTLVENEQI